MNRREALTTILKGGIGLTASLAIAGCGGKAITPTQVTEYSTNVAEYDDKWKIYTGIIWGEKYIIKPIENNQGKTHIFARQSETRTVQKGDKRNLKFEKAFAPKYTLNWVEWIGETNKKSCKSQDTIMGSSKITYGDPRKELKDKSLKINGTEIYFPKIAHASEIDLEKLPYGIVYSPATILSNAEITIKHQNKKRKVEALPFFATGANPEELEIEKNWCTGEIRLTGKIYTLERISDEELAKYNSY